MYSYSETLYALLDEFKPTTVFEWGPGTSTQIICLYPSVEKLVSVEHEIIFYDMVERLRFGNLDLKFIPDMERYVSAFNGCDFVFVDGRDRARCLQKAFNSNVVILHDAAREDYRKDIKKFKYQVWTDEGNTVTLTNNEETYEKIKSCLSKFICNEPETEKIIFFKKKVAV